ncbi:hypothetical protein [Streptomyces sp. Amel2xC10]|uniref:hypothetical protein n=1 Tax=Streptomyces sp. Amel2xC10 TaxID=1305826 RepID=UPI000A08E130|nr:hypothetical protein [Streptomyces sp. Amel2xC10]SMF86457.1 hypothetical protein SAMN02745830_07174 [Streptomyces sp. Amel2xC10]
MKTPGRIASQAGDLIREFNHETITSGTDWRFPPHAYAAIGSLAYLVRMLPQAIEQTLLPVQRTHKDGRVAVDGGGDPEAAVAELRKAAAQAVVLANRLSAAVDRMHSAVSPMGLDTRGLPEFED